MSRRLAWLGRRQQVLAQNIANADTPGYRARDLKQLSFRQLLGGNAPGDISLARTNPMDLGPVDGHQDGFKSVRDRKAEISLSNTSVNTEDQMMKVAKTAMDYELAINLYRKHLAIIKTALGR